MEKNKQFSISYFFAAFPLIVALQDYLAPKHVNHRPYSAFEALLRAGKIAAYDVSNLENGQRAK